jgi:hypothetical protein
LFLVVVQSGFVCPSSIPAEAPARYYFQKKKQEKKESERIRRGNGVMQKEAE